MSSRDPPIMKSMVDRSNPRTPATYIGTASFLPFPSRMLGGSDIRGSGYTLLGKKGNGKVSKNVLFAQNQGFDLQGISFFKISLNQRHYLPNQNVFQLWWKGIAYLWKKNLKHLLIENSFHSRLDWNTLEGGKKWYKRCKPSLLKDIILQRYYMCVEVQELFLLKWH